MNWNRKSLHRIMQAGTVALSACVLAGGAAAFSGTSAGTATAEAAERNATAGVVGELGEFQTEALASAISLGDADVTVVAAGETAEPAETEDTAETPDEEGTASDAWAAKAVANVQDSLNVRDSASEAGNIIGYLRRGDVADIVSAANGWTEITSGKVHGFVNNQYILTGTEAKNLINSIVPLAATSTVDGLRVRSEASEGAGVVTTLDKGETAAVDVTYGTANGWVKVVKDGKNGYVSSQYVTLGQNFSTAITVEEKQAAEAAAKAAKEAAEKKAAEEAAAKAAKAAKKASGQKAAGAAVQNAPTAASVDETSLLAAIIQKEAGSEPYTGQVAVGAVVMNRVRSGRYPSTITGVIYQRGQFGPARSSSLAALAASGPKASCMQAAREALAGSDPTGGALSFCNKSCGHAGTVIGNHVFW